MFLAILRFLFFLGYFLITLRLCSTTLHSLVLVMLLRLYLPILHSLVLITLLRCYGCTWLFYIPLFLLRYYVIMAALGYFTFHFSYTLLRCYGCTRPFYISLFVLLYYVVTAVLGYFTFLITLLRCYSCTRLFYISFFLLLDYIVTAVLSYFTFPCSYYFITLLWLYLAILDFLVLITLLCCDGCTRLFYISLFLLLYYVVTAVLGYFTLPFLFLLPYYIVLAVLRYFTFPCSYFFIALLRLYSAIFHFLVLITLLHY